MNIYEYNRYYVFGKYSFDRMYYGVAGPDKSHEDAIFFLTPEEASKHAEDLNKEKDGRSS